jgi:hypothetical protein
MKILYVMRNQAYMRNYESTLTALAQRGHQVKIRFNDYKDNDQLAERLAAIEPNLSYSYELLPDRQDVWRGFVKLIRAIRDYSSYLYPEYQQAHLLRKRVERPLKPIKWLVLPLLHAVASLPNQVGLKLLETSIDGLEWLVPPDPKICQVLAKENPDLMLITPLVDFDSVQRDYVKAARALNLKCGLCVHSWDNLTNKATIHIHPDRVWLWNEVQKLEAIKFHHLNPKEIVVTGAQCYDKWFDRKPSTDWDEFAHQTGLKSDQPYLLYLCSSNFIAPQEVGFVEEVLQAMRNAPDPQMSDLGLLVRPHPQNDQQWQEIDLSKWGNAVVWPAKGQNPVTEEAKANFYDSLFHSTAVIGVNTSAMIEAGILSKPVYSILDPRFQGTQEGTLHFHHLVQGGLLQLSHSIEEYIQQLSRLLKEGGSQQQEQIQQFIHQFVRPHGLDKPCTPILVESIESMEELDLPPRKAVPVWAIALRWIILPIVAVIELLRYSFWRITGAFNRFILKH